MSNRRRALRAQELEIAGIMGGLCFTLIDAREMNVALAPGSSGRIDGASAPRRGLARDERGRRLSALDVRRARPSGSVVARVWLAKESVSG